MGRINIHRREKLNEIRGKLSDMGGKITFPSMENFKLTEPQRNDLSIVQMNHPDHSSASSQDPASPQTFSSVDKPRQNVTTTR